MTTLSDGTTTLNLSDDLVWTDEFAWRPVAQQVDRSVTGALLIQTAALTAGRPITLASDATSGWLTRAQVDQMATWAAIVGRTLTLVLRGTTYSVAFSAAFDATPVVQYSDVLSTDHYTAIVRFITV